jgi:hypothetical protein
MNIGKCRKTKLPRAEHNTLKIGSAIEESVTEVRALQVGIKQISALQYGTAQVSLLHVRATQVSISQISPEETRFSHMRAPRGYPCHMRPFQYRTFQVGFAEIGSLQVNAGNIALLKRRQLPLIARQSSTRAGQRQVPQVDPMYIGPAQIQSQAFPILLIVPIHRPSSIIMLYQQPFNICPREPDPPERINILSEVRRDCQILGKLLLAGKGDFRLGTPG